MNLKILRHSRGFGVHSPFAYGFITEVLNGGGMYYAFAEEYGRLYGSGVIKDEKERQFFRICSSLKPTEVMDRSGSPRMAEIAKTAIFGGKDCKAIYIRESEDECNPLLILPETPAELPPEAQRILATGRGVIYFPILSSGVAEALFESVREAMPCGMTFRGISNKEGAVMVLRPDLPREDFTLKARL